MASIKVKQKKVFIDGVEMVHGASYGVSYKAYREPYGPFFDSDVTYMINQGNNVEMLMRQIKKGIYISMVRYVKCFLISSRTKN